MKKIAEGNRITPVVRRIQGKNMSLVGIGDELGIREGRRIHGLYTVSLDDMVNGKRHDDGICDFHFGIDIQPNNTIKLKVNNWHSLLPSY